MIRRHPVALLIGYSCIFAGLGMARADDLAEALSAGGGCAPAEINLTLNLESGSTFVAPGEVVTVSLDVGNLTSAINGAQVLVRGTLAGSVRSRNGSARSFRSNPHFDS